MKNNKGFFYKKTTHTFITDHENDELENVKLGESELYVGTIVNYDRIYILGRKIRERCTYNSLPIDVATCISEDYIKDKQNKVGFQRKK